MPPAMAEEGYVGPHGCSGALGLVPLMEGGQANSLL